MGFISSFRKAIEHRNGTGCFIHGRELAKRERSERVKDDAEHWTIGAKAGAE